MKRKIIFFLLISAFSLAAQQKYVKKEIPHDTSFTLSNTAVKVHKDFPFAELVISKLPERITEETNIIYTSYGERKLHLDIFSVARKEKTLYPGVILIHGGGWRSGDRSMEIPMAHFLAKNGYVTATVEYRLSPEALYPAAIYDLKVAIKWMRANALKYNINKSKIAVYGCSSGGQLAALVGTTNGILKFEGEKEYQNYSSDVQAVVDIDGVLDMTDPNESGKDIDPNKPSAAKQWLGVSYRDNPDLWKEASAINHVDKKSAPILFINSSLPRFHSGRDEMIEKMNKLNIYSEVHTIPNTPHQFWLFHPWFDETANYILKFLDKILKEE